MLDRASEGLGPELPAASFVEAERELPRPAPLLCRAGPSLTGALCFLLIPRGPKQEGMLWLLAASRSDRSKEDVRTVQQPCRAPSASA